LVRAEAITPVTSLQPPYSLIRREAERDLLPYCHGAGTGVLVYSPMASGLLTGAMTRWRVLTMPYEDWRRRDPEFNEPRLSRTLSLVDHLRAIAQRHGGSPGEVAVA